MKRLTARRAFFTSYSIFNAGWNAINQCFVILLKIEVRAHNSKAIYAKFYLFLPEKHSEHTDGWVIMGSSNLTEAGLGVNKSPNYELNIALKDYDDVEFAKGEFGNLWDKSTSIVSSSSKCETNI